MLPSDQKARAQSQHLSSLRRLSMIGVLFVLTFLGTVGVWSATAPISGAVVSSGKLVVTSHKKVVQHPTGGIVGALFVKEGDHVKQGQVVIELDGTLTSARLAVVTKKINELHARQARLTAEHNGFAELKFPRSLLDKVSKDDVQEAITTEQALFDARSKAHKQRKEQLRERVGQLKDEIGGKEGLLEAKRDQAKISKTELADLTDLDRKGLVQRSRLNAVAREASRVQGEIAETVSSISQIKGRIAETQMQILTLDDEVRAEAIKELREVQAELSRLSEERITSEDQLRRLKIRSPISGQVLQLAVHTVGGVIKAAEPLMELVPFDDGLEVVAPIAPQDFDQVRIGQTAEVKLQAVEQRNLPDLKATVKWIPSDVVTDPKTGASFYNVRLALTPESVSKLEGLKLVAGMQTDVFITTPARTFASYISKPVLDQMDRAFRER